MEQEMTEEEKKIPSVLDYMHDQPRALRDTFQRRDEFLTPFSNLLHEQIPKRIYFFGSGTSYNASLIAAYYFKHIAGIDAQGCYPTVFRNYEKPDWTGTLMPEEILYFGISQSGTSISTVDMMKAGQKQGIRTIALTEALHSEITKHVDDVLHLLCGKELNPPETRGYTVTLLQLYLLAWQTALIKGTKTQDEFQQAMKDAETLTNHFDIAVQEAEAWYDRNATHLVNSDRIYILGYGVDYGSALEGQLKIGEMLRLPAIGYELEEYSHGPTMAISPKQSILMFGSEEAEWQRCLEFRDAFRQYTQRVFLITYKECEHDARDCVFSIKTNKFLAPIMFTLPCQFTAAKGAVATDIDTSVDPFKIELSHLHG